MGLFGEVFSKTQQADRAGHIVVCALGQAGGIVMGGEGDVFVRLAGQIQDNVVGLALIFVLLQDDFCCFGIIADQFNGILGVDIHAGQLIALVDIAAQLPLVDIPHPIPKSGRSRKAATAI